MSTNGNVERFEDGTQVSRPCFTTSLEAAERLLEERDEYFGGNVSSTSENRPQANLKPVTVARPSFVKPAVEVKPLTDRQIRQKKGKS